MGPHGLGLLCTQLDTAGLIACQVPAFWCMKEPREAGLMTLLSVVKQIKGMMTEWYPATLTVLYQGLHRAPQGQPIQL